MTDKDRTALKTAGRTYRTALEGTAAARAALFREIQSALGAGYGPAEIGRAVGLTRQEVARIGKQGRR